jgi:hypothetical protein
VKPNNRLFRLPQWQAAPRFVRDRLTYGSFLSRRNCYLYVETPKVLSTSLKHFLRNLELGRGNGLDFAGEEVKPEMQVHARSNRFTASLADALATATNEQAEQLLAGPEFLRFCAVRNPYTRLVSAWYSKVYLGEPHFLPLRRHIDSMLPPEMDWRSFKRGHFLKFAELVCRLDASVPLVGDAHWNLQSNLLFPHAIKYDVVIRFEEFEKTFAPVHQWLKAHGADIVEPPGLLNAALGAGTPADYLDQRIADEIYRHFRVDFDLYSYPRDSWTDPSARESTGLPDDWLAHWEREVIERNRMIAALYQRLKPIQKR